MELKLKEGWLSYFFSGFIVGMIFVAISAAQYFQEDLISVTSSLNFATILVIAIAMSVSLFVIGCRVKRKD